MPNVRCNVCKAIASNEIISRIINKDKYDNFLTLDQVVQKVFAETGVSLHKVALLRHYKRHQDHAQTLAYERQCQVLRSLPGKKAILTEGGEDGESYAGKMRYSPRAKYSFDMLEKLKKMFVALSAQFEEFQKSTSGQMSEDNSETYAKIANAIVHIAADIARIEASKEVNKEIIKQEFINLFKEVIREFVGFTENKLTEAEKEELIGKMRDRVVEHTKRMDRNFRRKLI